ncbi:MAG TPA: pilus assembly protein N-terminal domain-containing protein [Polyangiaceae bacterium]
MRTRKPLPFTIGLLTSLALNASAQPGKEQAATPLTNAQLTKPQTTPGGNLEGPNESINLAIGETHTLSARGVRNWSEGVPGVVDVKLTGDSGQFLVSGRRAGSTTILFIRDNGQQQQYTVNVFARSPGAVEQELAQLLEGFTNVRVRRVGARHVLDGTVPDEKDLARIEHIAALYPSQVDSLVTVGVPTVPESEADVTGQKHFLLRIDFYFVQLDASSSYAVGLGWPSSIGGPNALQATGSYDLLAGKATQGAITVNQPLPRLDIAQAKGWGKVLKHATVVTNSGEAAMFRSGGSQNFPSTSGLAVGIQSLPFGVTVNVVPRFDPKRSDIALKIASEVSDLTAASPGTVIPGRAESKLETVVNVKLGQSIVLSGIRTSSQTHSVDGLPGLSRIPILGVLFGSHHDSSAEVEGAIYIIPSVIETLPNASTELIDSAVSKFKDFDGDVEGAHLNDRRPRPR